MILKKNLARWPQIIRRTEEQKRTEIFTTLTAMSYEEMNEVPVIVAEMATMPSNPEVISNIDPSFVTQCLNALNIGVSSFMKWCENIGISIEKMILTFHGAVFIFTERIKTFVYNCIYNLTLYWLLYAPTKVWFFPFHGYQGMNQNEICSRILDISFSNFRNGENSALCEEAIDGVVTGRTTIVIYCLACVLSCLFVVFYLPLLIEFIKYIWTYKDRMRQEEYDREQKEKAEKERKKAEDELLAKKAADSVERKLNNAKNKVVKTVISKIFGIIGMNDHESRNKVVEIRNILDCLHDKEGEQYRRAAQELQWDKKDWILSGNPRVTTNIVGLLENIDNYEGETSYEYEEEDDN